MALYERDNRPGRRPTMALRTPHGSRRAAYDNLTIVAHNQTKLSRFQEKEEALDSFQFNFLTFSQCCCTDLTRGVVRRYELGVPGPAPSEAALRAGRARRRSHAASQLGSALTRRTHDGR
ncbi:hypothetical protein EVAR_33044_1 [Eumeta japonica]|uniref:Uncharacterized protein n=1 Tax=Eumeta variegata TaxID=151549 RepID=A0A4C1WWY0_EUMVA|nr:hypothetical protein EVAR_33044_1 [Eumeta japonica]